MELARARSDYCRRRTGRTVRRRRSWPASGPDSVTVLDKITRLGRPSGPAGAVSSKRWRRWASRMDLPSDFPGAISESRAIGALRLSGAAVLRPGRPRDLSVSGGTCDPAGARIRLATRAVAPIVEWKRRVAGCGRGARTKRGGAARRSCRRRNRVSLDIVKAFKSAASRT